MLPDLLFNRAAIGHPLLARLQVNPLFMMRDSGLFHMVRFYSDGVFKAFWRDALEKDPTLPETKRFAEKHKAQFPIIQELAMKE